jgi:ABC-type multidrug transport system fused ATPase/permease subunit
MVRRGAVIGLLALVERLLTPAAAWVFFERSFTTKVGVTFALAVVFTAHQFVWRAFAARSETELTARAIDSLLAGEVLQASVLSGEDAQAELGQGFFSSAQVLSQGLPTLVADLAASAVLTVVVVAVEPARIVIVAVSLTLAAAFVLGWSRSRLQNAFARAWDLQSRVFDTLVDALQGRQEIVASGGRVRFLAEASERSRAWGAASAHVAGSTVLSGRVPMLAIAGIVGLFVAADSRGRGSLSVSLADLALFASVAPAFAGVAQGLQSIGQAERWMRIVAQVVSGARPFPRGSRLLLKPPASVAFEGVSFRYAGAEADDVDVLRDVSFTWDGSGILGLSGANGSGKSTCLRLLLALAAPRVGAIRVDGVDLADLDADAWRTRIAFLPQRPYLPPRSSIRAAVRFLAAEASDDRIRKALDRVALTAALNRDGDDPLEVNVDTLSVGQRQRVALARMLCRDASLFLLDEPEANLDRAGIELVTDIVRELAANHMVIIAAHTPELLLLASRVVVLDGGPVVRREAP